MPLLSQVIFEVLEYFFGKPFLCSSGPTGAFFRNEDIEKFLRFHRKLLFPVGVKNGKIILSLPPFFKSDLFKRQTKGGID